MNDYFELAMVLVGLDPDNDDDFNKASDEIDDLLYEKFQIDSEALENLLNELVKFTMPTRTAITNDPVQGFVDPKKKMFLYKQPYTPESDD